MARAKISEYRAKTMLLERLDRAYAGISVDASQPLEPQLVSLDEHTHYVVKVDQAVKKRMKQGLVLLDRPADTIAGDILRLSDKGYRYLLVEPMFAHDPSAEHYLSLSNGREGAQVAWSAKGGIDIEEAADSVQTGLSTDEVLARAAEELDVPVNFLRSLVETFDAAYSCFLEINPLVTNGDEPMLLDVAAEVDGEAAHLTRRYWTPDDERSYRQLTPEEMVIAELASKSRASLRYEVINPDGAVWLLLSGGGASIVVADEVNNRGRGELLGNYGEYSGNPSEPETFAYSEQLILSLLKSKAPRKVIVIAGGIANFTDVRTTFGGIIRALTKYASKLKTAGVKVYVRRGGPHDLEGLAIIRNFLASNGLLGEVHGPELPLAESVSAALVALEAN